jgi:hypothetical protein
MKRAGSILILILALVAVGAPPARAQESDESPGSIPIRVATFNIEDVSTTDLLVNDQPRIQRLAEVIQRLRPNVLLVNEIAFDR